MLTLSLNAFASNDPYYVIENVEVKEVERGVLPTNYDMAYQNEKGLGDIIMIGNQILAFGKKIWAIVEAGRPTSSTNFANTISVLPKMRDITDVVFDMDGWEAPRFVKYRVEYKNGFGMTVIGFTYMVQYQYNGQYKGKGRYLTGLTVTASEVNVRWGFNFDASSNLIAITNRGSKDDPMAGATMEIKYRAKSITSDISNSVTFHVSGDGKIIQR